MGVWGLKRHFSHGGLGPGGGVSANSTLGSLAFPPCHLADYLPELLERRSPSIVAVANRKESGSSHVVHSAHLFPDLMFARIAQVQADALKPGGGGMMLPPSVAHQSSGSKLPSVVQNQRSSTSMSTHSNRSIFHFCILFAYACATLSMIFRMAFLPRDFCTQGGVPREMCWSGLPA